MRQDDRFELYDLRVEVVAGEREMVCNHREGDYFELRGENLSLPAGQSFPLYPLAALLPLLPGQAAPDPSQRLDDLRRRNRLSGSPLWAPAFASSARASRPSATARSRAFL